MKFKIGDKVEIVGRAEWKEYGWNVWKSKIGKVGTVTRAMPLIISVERDGKYLGGFLPESLKKVAGVGEQLEFDFMR